MTTIARKMHVRLPAAGCWLLILVAPPCTSFAPVPPTAANRLVYSFPYLTTYLSNYTPAYTPPGRIKAADKQPVKVAGPLLAGAYMRRVMARRGRGRGRMAAIHLPSKSACMSGYVSADAYLQTYIRMSYIWESTAGQSIFSAVQGGTFVDEIGSGVVLSDNHGRASMNVDVLHQPT